ncbi:MAG: RimK family alpha-L-glutamate ligase [Alphaproteobacteria bacterium]
MSEGLGLSRALVGLTVPQVGLALLAGRWRPATMDHPSLHEAQSPGKWPPQPLGLARLAFIAFRGASLMPIAADMMRSLIAEPRNAATLMDLSTIHYLTGRPDVARSFQRQALAVEQVYRQSPVCVGDGGVRLLMFATPGDFMANMPIQFIVDGTDITLDVLYVGSGVPLPRRLPEHDVLMLGIGESDQTRELLAGLGPLMDNWSQPALNDPRRVLSLSRDSLWQVLAGEPTIRIPATVRVDRPTLSRLADGSLSVDAVLPGGRFPVILRPIGSHAGRGLEKLDGTAAMGGYLAIQEAETFYLSSYVDYRSEDGMFRKYRIAFIDGHPYVCHVAIAGHWMLHYLNAGMWESEEKRAEEARIFETFEDDFVRRNAEALGGMARRIGLEYFVVDCAVTRDDKVLVFEADIAMILHAMEPCELFPYKAPQMRKVFEAFRDMLHRRVHHQDAGPPHGREGE